ncbi:MAG: hypothetical protein HXY39_15300 [Chloroflexi bacterium]|nr:hypothetical protein [Chloroflexota bacterium]
MRSLTTSVSPGRPGRLAAMFGLALTALLALPAGWLLWMSLARAMALLAYPYPHDGLEGTLLYEALLWRNGEALYQPLELYRFVSAPYPPLYYVALMIAGTDAGPHVFWNGRLVSAATGLVIAGVVTVLVGRGTGSWIAGALGATLILSAPPMLLWGTRIKPDVLALGFTALGLLLTSLVISPARQRDQGDMAAGTESAGSATLIPWPLLGATLCFVAAFFTKQTAIAGPLAAGVALLAADVHDWLALRYMPEHRQPMSFVRRLPLRWRTLVFAGLYLALALGIWAVLDLLTARAYTLHVWWNFQRGSWWSFALLNKIVSLLGFWWPLMLLSAVTILLAARDRRLLVAAAYMLTAPLTLSATGETGANHNHLLETHLALAITGASATGWALSVLSRRPLIALPLIGLLGLQLALAGRPPDWYTNQLVPNDPPERFLVFMRHTPGEILADDTGLLFQAGKPLRYDDPSTMGPAARTGKWDQRGLLEDIAAQRFSAIMIPVNVEKSDRDASGRWTPEMLAAINQHYRLLYRDTIFTYVPRER